MAKDKTSQTGKDQTGKDKDGKRREQVDEARAGQAAIEPGYATDAPYEAAAEELGLEAPPEFDLPEAVLGDLPPTPLEGVAASDGGTVEQLLDEASPAAPGDQVADDSQATWDTAELDAAASSAALPAGEIAAAAAPASGDTPVGMEADGVKSALDPGASDQEDLSEAAPDVQAQETQAALEVPAAEGPEALAETSPPDEVKLDEPSGAAEILAGEEPPSKSGPDEPGVLPEAALQNEPENDEAEVAGKGEEAETLLEEPPVEVTAAPSDDTVDVEPAAARKTSTETSAAGTTSAARPKLAELADAPGSSNGEDGAEPVSSRSLEALLQEVDEKMARLPGEEGFREEDADSGRETEQYVSFILANSRYAIRIGQASEIEKVPRVSWVPNVPNFVLGVTNLRGDVTAVIDLSQFLGIGAAEQTDESRILVVKVGSEALTTALVVDRVLGLSVVDPNRIGEPTGPVDDTVGPLLRGVYEDGDSLVNLLDLDQVFRSSELQTLIKV